MNISPDGIVIWQFNAVTLNATILFTWIVMVLLVVGSLLVTHRLSTETRFSHWQTRARVLADTLKRERLAVMSMP